LALTESVTRLSDREDPVPDPVWARTARHYGREGLAALILAIANINVWNRLNTTSGRSPGRVAGVRGEGARASELRADPSP
jgi:alkylhydroperoxidase family enzyme